MRYKKMRQDKTQTQNLFSQKEESGRSMIEMLGVLAIIGVLSIGGVWGYRYALSKYQSNEIIDAVTMRVITVIEVLEGKNQAEGVIQDGLPDQTHLGQPIESLIAPENPDYFKIEVDEIEPAICRQILRDYQKASFIQVGDTIYNQDTGICGDTDKVTMGFVYKKDMTDMGACSEKGYFGSEDFQCHCSGNTYIDPYSNECICPAGHVWSAGENTCVESICGEGQFESLKGCISCDDPAQYTISSDASRVALCLACPNRGYMTAYNRCVNMDTCPFGTAYYTTGLAGSCQLCGGIGNVDMTAAISVTGCTSCPNMYVNSGYCLNKKTCPDKTFKTVGGVCISCDTPESVNIGTHPDHSALCRSCTNADGKINRIVSGSYCLKTVCNTTEFKGNDGKCYPCTQEQSVFIGTTNTEAINSCQTPACNREAVNGYCQLKTCQTADKSHVRLPDGSCYDCTQREPFHVNSEEECNACSPARRVLYGSGINACTLESLCKKGNQYPYLRGTYCYACTGAGEGCAAVGTGDFAQEYCEACNGHLTNIFCVYNNACTRGSQFRTVGNWNYKICPACEAIEKFDIGRHPLERDMCSACTTQKRFFAGIYCYRCDSSENPIVSGTDEITACESCGNRKVDNNRCVLKQ